MQALSPFATLALAVARFFEAFVPAKALPTPDPVPQSIRATLLDNGLMEFTGMSVKKSFAAKGLPYGVSATRNMKALQGIILHHPFVPLSWEPERTIKLINTKRPDGNMYGYSVVIAPDGRSWQTAPLNVRTNHIKSPRSSKRIAQKQLSNANTIGIAFHHASHETDMKPTPAAMATAEAWINALRDEFPEIGTNIFGHGEIQSDRARDEGRLAAEYFRKN